MSWTVHFERNAPGGGISQAPGDIIPASRRTTWQPGLTYNGGIPNYTTIFATLSPQGAGLDDTSNIFTNLRNAGAQFVSSGIGQVVKLTTGTFNINGGGLFLDRSGVVLRGSGPGSGGTLGTIASDGTYSCSFSTNGTGTFLNKQDRATNGTECIGFGPNFNQSDPTAGYNTSVNLVADAVKETTSCLIGSNPSLSNGQIVLIDINTDSDPNTFWGERHEAAGVTFTADTGGVSSTTVTTSNVIGTIWPGNYTDFNTGSDNSTFTYPTAGTTGQTFFIAQTGGVTGGAGTYTLNRAATFSNQVCFAGLGTRRFFNRQDRSVGQLMKITSVVNNGNGTFTVSFETPFHLAFPTSLSAQLTTFGQPFVSLSGIEDLYVFGGRNGDGGGNINCTMLDNCWIKHVESHFSQGSGINIISCYRPELRDSYLHESPNPNPGGDGYNMSLNTSTSEALVENNIMIIGNKNIVMRGTGGGNVVGYNYMDDAFGSQFPDSPEAGVNAGHNASPHMELLEGNYSHNYKGDSFWGSSTYITVHRNWITLQRAGHGPLGAYTYINPSSVHFKYGDFTGRDGMDIQAGSYFTNLVGNVIGVSGQSLLSEPNGTDPPQSQFVYENYLNFTALTNPVIMWNIGTDQSHQGIDGNAVWVATTIQTQLRMGNWDWFTQTQKWHGIGGTNTDPQVAALPMRSSYYLSGPPAFFVSNSYGANTWPWVNPANGATATLPAKARFDAGTPNLL